MKLRAILKKSFLILLITFIILELAGYLLQSYKARKLLISADSGENLYDPWSQWIPSWNWDRNTGFRKTVFNPAASDSAITVWMFGGSTMVGFTDNDSLRIPSIIARQESLMHSKKPVRFLNWGVSGYNSQQEIRLFINLLGRFPKPDVVVFYDGGNDIATQLTYNNVNAHFYYERFSNVTSFPLQLPFVRSIYFWYVNSYVYNIQFLIGKMISYSSNQEQYSLLVKESSHSYFRLAETVVALCKSNCIKPVFILQPFLLAEKEPSDKGEKAIWNSKPSSYRALVREYYSNIRNMAWDSGVFVDLSNAFQGRSTRYYRDPIHLFDPARILISDSIFKRIHPVVTSINN